MTRSHTLSSDNLGSLNDTFIIDLGAYNVPDEVQMQVIGTFVATITFMISHDGVSWSNAGVTSWASGGIISTTTVPVGVIFYSPPRFVRALMNAWTSGSADVLIDQVFRK